MERSSLKYISISSSLYSYIALIQVIKTRALLKQHSVDVDIHPILLGAVNAASGNKPPWTLPAKAAFGAHDARRSLRAVGLLPPSDAVSAPGDLMEAGKSQVALRALLCVKDRFPELAYLATWRALMRAFWTLHRPPITPAALREALERIPAAAAMEDGLLGGSSSSSSGGTSSPPKKGKGNGEEEGEEEEEGERKLFSPAEVAEIEKAESSPEYKAKLRATTQEALERGAFGAPWMWVTHGTTGRGEPFFGSDRWSHVYAFLGLPYRDVELLPPGGARGSGAKL
ncbi:thioredoxin-like protein [Daldinia caldariorum]|uniref:thioredoxin-like protein n=1 Tax=Daldinia caldariorum TaxID=326644 RepID=UPI002008A9B9|nr:thioredoxin-like protein [Daldinia caldariorum]KAI1466991.1 thioredoxin-like protein [Daldinia caldariorum]